MSDMNALTSWASDRTPYQVLGVQRDAPDAVIKAAHQAQLKLTHPDTGGSNEQAALVNLAYALIASAERRAELDAFLDATAGNVAQVDDDEEWGGVAVFFPDEAPEPYARPGTCPPPAAWPAPAPTPGAYRQPPYQPYSTQYPPAMHLGEWPRPTPVSTRGAAMWAHLGGLLGVVFVMGFGGFVAPLVILLLRASSGDGFTVTHAREALNFQLTFLIGVIASNVLPHDGLWLLLWAPYGLGGLALMARGAYLAAKGQTYRYPLCLRLVRLP